MGKSTMHVSKPRDTEPDDYDEFIGELQEILRDVPPGFQSKFARVVAALQQEKLEKTAEIRAVMVPDNGNKIDYEVLLQTLQHALNDPAAGFQKRFNAAFQLAKLREERTLLKNGKDTSE